MKVAVAQLVCELGDVAANCATMQRLAKEAAAQGCDVVVFPEMADTGYEMKTIAERASTWEAGPLRQLQEAASRLRTRNAGCLWPPAAGAGLRPDTRRPSAGT